MLTQSHHPPAVATTLPVIGVTLFVVLLMASAIVSNACSSPTNPTKFEPPPGAYRSVFTLVKGEGGAAGMSITPKAIPEATMAGRARR